MLTVNTFLYQWKSYEFIERFIIAMKTVQRIDSECTYVQYGILNPCQSIPKIEIVDQKLQERLERCIHYKQRNIYTRNPDRDR